MASGRSDACVVRSDRRHPDRIRRNRDTDATTWHTASNLAALNSSTSILLHDLPAALGKAPPMDQTESAAAI
jgi:hypothetical protein